MILLRTLYAKLALFLAALLAAMGVIHFVITLSITRHYQSEVSQIFNRDLARNLVAERNLVQEGQIDNARLKETFHYYMTINPSIEIYLLDIEGNILSYSAEPSRVKRERVSLDPIKAFLNNNVFPVLGDDPRHSERQKAFSVTPVPSSRSPEGYLYVVLRGEQYDRVDRAMREGYLIRVSAWTVGITLLIGLLTGLYVFHLLTRRLQNLSRAMDAFRASGLSEPIAYASAPSHFDDEIDRLSATFTQMAERIRNQIQELRDNDRRRREVVAHVSHDLRTPLATLYGYLETLKIKSSALSPAERDEYMEIALKHGERLNRLVSDLFELAKLDAGQAPPDSEPFSPAELVQDVIQKFALRAREHRVKLDTIFSVQIPHVVADIGLIERVLENLIENAFHYAPTDGKVIVHVRGGSDSVTLAVEDNGSGIAEEDLPRIFDQFYRAGDDHRGTGRSGLGLTISKRILELHGSELRIESVLGEGAIFSFSLPVWKGPES